MVEILAMATIIAPITSGVVQVVKQATQVNNRYLPAVATILGMGLGAAAYFLDAELCLRVWDGVIVDMDRKGKFRYGNKNNKRIQLVECIKEEAKTTTHI